MSKFDRRLKARVEKCGITGKRMFKSAFAAMQFVTELGSECNASMMRPYHCLRCGGYHLTSQEYDPSRRYEDYQRHQQRREQSVAGTARAAVGGRTNESSHWERQN